MFYEDYNCIIYYDTGKRKLVQDYDESYYENKYITITDNSIGVEYFMKTFLKDMKKIKLSDIPTLRLKRIFKNESFKFRDDMGKLISILEKELERRNEALENKKDEQNSQTNLIKLQEIDAINKNTEMQKYLAETVLGAVTYLAQILNK